MVNPRSNATRQKPKNNKTKLGVVAGGGLNKKKNNNNAKGNIKKLKGPSIKNQIRSTQRLLQRDIPAELRDAQEKKLKDLKKQQLEQNRLVEERKTPLRDKKFKFFERRKIERRMRRMEKQQRGSLNEEEEKKIAEELGQLKKDLEYVRFFPKAEKYVPLFCGDDNPELVENRNRLRLLIKANIIAAAASGKDLEETGSEDGGPTDLTDDDFFVSGSSSDEADADDELTDLSAREQAPIAPTKAALVTKDKTIQRQRSAQSLMPPPRPPKSSAKSFDYPSTSRNTSKNRKIFHSSDGGYRHGQASQSSNTSSNSDFPKHSNDRRFRHAQVGQSSNKSFNTDTSKHSIDRRFVNREVNQSSNRSYNSDAPRHSNDGGFQNAQASQSSNISSNSDAPKRKRKRRPKKKKE